MVYVVFKNFSNTDFFSVRKVKPIVKRYWTISDCVKVNSDARTKFTVLQSIYVVRCAIWYHLYNLKNVKNTL